MLIKYEFHVKYLPLGQGVELVASQKKIQRLEQDTALHISEYQKLQVHIFFLNLKRVIFEE